MVRSEQISSHEELYYVLQVNGVDLTKADAKKTWRKQSAIQIKYEVYNDYSNETDEEVATISTILEVWETDINERIALWNSGNIKVYDSHDDVAYNYIDKGRHFIMSYTSRRNGYFLMFGLNKDIISKLKKNFDFVLNQKDVRVFLHFTTFNKIVQDATQVRDTRKEERKKYDEIQKQKMVDEKKQATAKERRNALGDKFMSTENMTIGNLMFTKDLLIINDQKFGIEGLNLRGYFGKAPFLDYLTNLDGMLVRFTAILQDKIREQMKDKETFNLYDEVDSIDPGRNMKIWLGSFSFALSYYIDRGVQQRKIDEEKITKASLYYMLPHVVRMEKKEELEGLMDDLKKFPPSIRGFTKEGLVVRAGKDKIPIRILVTKEKGKLYFVHGTQLYHIGDGVKTLNYLQRTWDTKYRAFKELSKYIPRDAVVKLIKRATLDRVEAIRKSQELIDDMLKNNPENVAKSMFSPHGNADMVGFVVKGKKKDYFIDQKTLGVYSYPQGRYMCIVDKGQGKDYTRNDKLVTRMLMLLNDDRFKDTMSYFT